MKWFPVVVFVGLLSFSSLFFLTPVLAYYTNMGASVAVGQPNLTSNISINAGNPTASTFSNPSPVTPIRGIIVDSRGRLLVVDSPNNRILIWNQVPTANGTPADLVLGQPDFTSNTVNNGGKSASTLNFPYQIASDGTRLAIADTVNSRVLIWNTLPTTNNQPADVVVGQTDMVSAATTCDSSHLNRPQGISIYNGKLIVDDGGNAGTPNRIMIWNTVPTTNGVAADIVLGQPDFTTCGLSATAANTLSGPGGIYTDATGRLFVSDRTNNRVLIWNSIPTINNQPADVVLGQPDFTSNSVNQGGSSPTANTMQHPQTVFSSGNKLFVGDTDNNRVLVYNSIPTTNNASANLVIGQTDFTSNIKDGNGSTSPKTLARAHVVYEHDNKLFISDCNSSCRLLIFNNIIATPEISMTGITKTNDGKLKISGNIKVGEAGHYDLGGGGGVSFSINGNDGAGVNSIGNQINDGNGSLYYDFSNTFDPWTGSNGTKDDWTGSFDNLRSSRGFTVKITSQNSNTDSSHIFYFEPFNMVSLTAGTATLSVNKYQIQRIKDNIDHFDIEVKKDTQNLWKPYLTNISTNNINMTTGIVTAVTSNSLPAGNYQVRAVSVSKDSNGRQNSNEISLNLTSIIPAVTYINPGNYAQTVGQWFPLQINSLSPDINGISFANTTVAVRVTNQATGTYKDYYTTTDSSSHFLFPPLIYGNSLLTISTYDTNGRYTSLPPIRVGY